MSDNNEKSQIVESKYHITEEEFQELLDTAPVVKITDAVPERIKHCNVSKEFDSDEHSPRT